MDPKGTAAPGRAADGLELAAPTITDGADLWRIAADSESLDLNSSYAYLLWCRDFAGTSVVARVDGEVVGYVTGYRRPDEPSTLVVWQVAVTDAHRGEGVAGRMLDALAGRLVPDGVDHVETTITPDNMASVRLFEGFAARRDAPVETSVLFDTSTFPDGHDAEVLHRIGPFAPGAPTTEGG